MHSAAVAVDKSQEITILSSEPSLQFSQPWRDTTQLKRDREKNGQREVTTKALGKIVFALGLFMPASMTQ